MAQRTCRHPDGCPRPARKQGWCTMHYQRVRATGDVGPVGKLTSWGELRGTICSVDDCGEPATLKGWCRFHYDRVRFNGETGSAARLRRVPSAEVRAYTPSQRHRYFKYGLTPEAFDEILARQGGRCYICRTTEPVGKGWSVDHCHESKVVRFIACNPCNAALGLVREDPKIAKRLYEVTLECQQMRLA